MSDRRPRFPRKDDSDDGFYSSFYPQQASSRREKPARRDPNKEFEETAPTREKAARAAAEERAARRGPYRRERVEKVEKTAKVEKVEKAAEKPRRRAPVLGSARPAIPVPVAEDHAVEIDEPTTLDTLLIPAAVAARHAAEPDSADIDDAPESDEDEPERRGLGGAAAWIGTAAVGAIVFVIVLAASGGNKSHNGTSNQNGAVPSAPFGSPILGNTSPNLINGGTITPPRPGSTSIGNAGAPGVGEPQQGESTTPGSSSHAPGSSPAGTPTTSSGPTDTPTPTPTTTAPTTSSTPTPTPTKSCIIPDPLHPGKCIL